MNKKFLKTLIVLIFLISFLSVLVFDLSQFYLLKILKKSNKFAKSN